MGGCLGTSINKAMASTKYFECTNCDTQGKITVKTNDITVEDIVYCPVCGADIYEEDEDYEE